MKDSILSSPTTSISPFFLQSEYGQLFQLILWVFTSLPLSNSLVILDFSVLELTDLSLWKVRFSCLCLLLL